MNPSTENTRTEYGSDGSGGSSQQSAGSPRLCSRGCGFYGSPENRGMCSKCFNDSLKDKVLKSESALIGTAEGVSDESEKIKIPMELEASRIGDFSNKASICTDQSVPETPTTSNCSNNGSSSLNEAVPVAKNRCGSCRKKVGMLGFGCRCGGTFCGKHRYPEEHSCNFDFKKVGKVMIEKENPLCKADKIKDRI